MILAWDPTVGLDGLIEQLKDVSKRVKSSESVISSTVTIDINGIFISVYMRLEQAIRRHLLSALSAAPITDVRISSIRLPDEDDHLPAFRDLELLQQLCMALSSIPTLTAVHLDYSSCDPALSTLLFRQLRSITSLTLLGSTRNFCSTMASVRGHKCLECLILCVPTNQYDSMIVFLTAMPSLTKLKLRTNYGSISRRDAHAVSAVLQSSLALQVTLKYFVFPDETTQSILLAGIAASNVHGLELDGGIFSDAASLVTALTRTRLKMLGFSRGLWFQQGDWLAFYTLLAERLSSMRQLQHLDCTRFNGIQSARYHAYDRALMLLIDAVTHHPGIQRFECDLSACSDAMDQALAQLVRTNSTLTHLELRLPRPRLPTSENHLPALLSGMHTNYTLQTISLSAYYPFGSSPWQADFVRMMHVWTRLNRAGRFRLTSMHHPVMALRVLERVADDLDCVWCHVVEHGWVMVMVQPQLQ